MKYKFITISILVITVLVYLLLKNSTANTQALLNSNKFYVSYTADEQEAKLFELCKVWGILKYHDTQFVNENCKNDALIIKIFSEIEKNTTDFNTIISHCIEAFDTQKKVSNDIYFTDFPDKEWIESSLLINRSNKVYLSHYILDSYNDSSERMITKNKYGELNFEKDNCFFDKTKTTKAMRFLSLCKIWNIIRYYYPYFDEISEDWNSVFFEMLPLFLDSKTENDYFIAVQKFTSKIKDSHVACKSINIDDSSHKYVSNYILKTIEGKTFVKDFVTNSLPTNLRKGDEIKMINGVSIVKMQDSLRELTSGSNEIVLLRDVNKILLFSNKQVLNLQVLRNNQLLQINQKLTPIAIASEGELTEHKSYASQTVSKILNKNIGYINCKEIFSGNFRISFEKIKNCSAIIFDLRSYPNETGIDFIKNFDLIENKPMILYSSDVIYPGFMRTIDEVVNVPKESNDSYSRPVVLLINEYTQSQGESLLLAMRSSIKNSISIGDFTAGTNGNITVVSLPGGIKTRFSGIGILTANFGNTQRLGIKPDILIREDINTLLKGEDIQLKRALNFINTMQNEN